MRGRGWKSFSTMAWSRLCVFSILLPPFFLSPPCGSVSDFLPAPGHEVLGFILVQINFAFHTFLMSCHHVHKTLHA